MAKMFVTSGKILANKIIVLYIKHDENDNDEISVIKEESASVPHSTLKKALQALAPHAAILSEFLHQDSIEDIKKPSEKIATEFHINGFAISGGELMKGVVITAQKKLSNGKVFGFNTPYLLFGDESDEAYTYEAELISALKKIQTEFISFLNGKRGKAEQPKMDFGAQQDTEIPSEDKDAGKSLKSKPRSSNKATEALSENINKAKKKVTKKAAKRTNKKAVSEEDITGRENYEEKHPFE